jgi:hypothetical protein
MPKGPKGEKRPADANQLAKFIVDAATETGSDGRKDEGPKVGPRKSDKIGSAQSRPMTGKLKES